MKCWTSLLLLLLALAVAFAPVARCQEEEEEEDVEEYEVDEEEEEEGEEEEEEEVEEEEEEEENEEAVAEVAEPEKVEAPKNEAPVKQAVEAPGHVKVVSFDFRLRKPEPVTLNQLEARVWTDPAWEINISGTDNRHLKDIRMVISGLMQQPKSGGRLYSLKNGDPFHYHLRYKFHCPKLEGFTHYSVNGGQLFQLDEVSEIGVREVIVEPYNWCPYLNGIPIDSNTEALIRNYVADQRVNDPDFALVIDRPSTECVPSSTAGNIIIRCRDHYYLPGSDAQSVEYGFDLLPNKRNLFKCLKVNFCEPEGKCGQNAKCIPQEKGDYKCVCKDGYGLAAGFSQSKPSDPVECVDYCAEGQEGYLRRVENGSPYLLCHGTPDKFPYYELTCAKGSVLKNGVCVKDCLCQKDSTECVVDYVNFEHTCKCRPGFEKVPESVLHCKPIYEKVSSIRLREHQVGERRRFASMSIDQCSTYSEPGYIIDGNTGDIDDFDVLYNLPHQLAEEMVVQTGTFDVEFALAKKPDSLVVRHVTVRPVDRCLTQYSNCGIQCQPNMICTPRVGSDYPRDINCSCPQPKGCHNWQDARLSVDEKDKAFYDFVSTHHEKHTHSTINRDRCTDTHYVGNLPNETVCVDVAPPVIFLLGDNPTFLTSCIVCFDDHHPNSTHTDYTDKGAISYDYFDGEKKELKGHLQGTIRPVQDAPPSEKKQLLQALVAHGYDSNEDVSYSVYRYEASDRSGNVVTFDRHVFYITTNISKEVKKLVELQRQLDSIGEAISYAKQFLTAVIVIALFWFLFTAEGKNLLYTIFLKITHPGWTWAEAVLEVEKKKIMNDLGHIKDSRSQVNQYSEGK